MGEDLSTGAKIGIILIILCSLIAIVFALLTMMKNITNTGSAQLQNGLDQMLLTNFDDYNQKTVSGTQVISALRIFEGQDIAIVVKPGLCNYNDFAGGYCYNAVLSGYTKSDAEMPGYGYVYTSKNQINVTTVEGITSSDTLVSTFVASNPGVVSTKVQLHETGAYYIGELEKPEGQTTVTYNMNTKPITATSTSAYVRSNAKYRAMLIKDTAGTNIGIVFNEIVA